MNKPADFDNVQEFTNVPQLPPGGYICRIIGVQETTAKSSGAAMLKIGVDIAEGEFKGHFQRLFDSDNRSDKKWRAVVNQLVYAPDGSNTTNRGFKTFVTSVQKSNNGFQVQWGNNFAPCFKGRLVGVVFRREGWIDDNGEVRFTTKPAWFHSVDEIRKGVPVPEDKIPDDVVDYISDNNITVPSAPAKSPANNFPQNFDPSDFEEVGTGDLPF